MHLQGFSEVQGTEQQYRVNSRCFVKLRVPLPQASSAPGWIPHFLTNEQKKIRLIYIRDNED